MRGMRSIDSLRYRSWTSIDVVVAGAGSNWRLLNHLSGSRFDGAEKQVVPLKGARVLLVDDAADYIAMLADVLKLHGIQVVIAGSVEEAITSLRGGQVDLVVTDLCLPGASGIDLV